MAAIPFTFGTGILSATGVRFSVYSLSSANVTVSISGLADIVLTMTGYGTDGIGGATDSSGTYPIALYRARVDLLGLSSVVQALSVTQNGVTRAGQTTPDRGDTGGRAIFITCDSPLSNTSGVGAWPAIRNEVESGEVFTIIHTDDHGYTASLAINDTGAGGTGRYCNAPNIDWTEYSRYLAYAAYLGLLETDVDSSGYVPDFQQPDRIWCREHCPIWASVGDWELNNNPAEDATITAAQNTTAKTAYFNTVGSNTKYLNAANSMAWVQHVGPLEVIAYDRCFALKASTQYYNPTTEVNNTAESNLLGTKQIADIKGGLDTVSPFKVVAASMSMKHITDASFRLAEKATWFNSSWFGAQQPMHDYTADTSGDAISYVSENRNLYTANLDSICAVAKSYGAAVVTWHGDTHRPFEYYHYSPADANNVELDMIECSAGTVNGVFAHRLHPKIKEGYSYRGTTVNWLAPWTYQLATGSASPKATYLSIDLPAGGDMTINYKTYENGGVKTERSTVIKRNGANQTSLQQRLGRI